MVAILQRAARIILVAFFAAFVSAERRLSEKELVMYHRALQRYHSASQQSVGIYHLHNYEPDPLERWRKGSMKAQWLASAKNEGVMHIGKGRDWLGRKVVYFSSIVRPRDNELTAAMGLRRDIPVEGGNLEKEAAIFWKHVGGVSRPLKVDFLNHYQASYPLEPLKDVLHGSSTRVHPLR